MIIIPPAVAAYDRDRLTLEKALPASGSSAFWIVDEATSATTKALAAKHGAIPGRGSAADRNNEMFSANAAVIQRRGTCGWINVHPWEVPGLNKCGGHVVSYIRAGGDGAPFPAVLARVDDGRVAVFPSAIEAATAAFLHDRFVTGRGPGDGLGWAPDAPKVPLPGQLVRAAAGPLPIQFGPAPKSPIAPLPARSTP